MTVAQILRIRFVINGILIKNLNYHQLFILFYVIYLD